MSEARLPDTRTCEPSAPLRIASRRTDAILLAIRRELEAYRTVVDQGEDIGCVTVTVRLHMGTSEVKSIVFAAERPRPRLAGRNGLTG